MRFKLLLAPLMIILIIHARSIHRLINNKVCPVSVPDTHCQQNFDHDEKIPRALKAFATHNLPPGECKKTKNNLFFCFSGRRKCSKDDQICFGSGGFPCDCAFDPYSPKTQAMPTRLIPPGQCRAVRTGQLFCFDGQRKCAEAAGTCATKGQTCQCEYNPYPSSWHENHRRSIEGTLIDQSPGNTSEDQCRNTETRHSENRADLKTCIRKTNHGAIATHQQHGTSTVSDRKDPNVDSSEDSMTKQERRSPRPPMGTCSIHVNTIAETLHCRHRRRICSHTPNSCVKSMPCQCDYDPYFEGPESREKSRLLFKKRREEHRKWEEQVKASKNKPSGLRIVVGGEISDEDESLPPGKCRRPNGKSLLQCCMGLKKCSNDRCIGSGSLCKCQWDPRDDAAKAQERAITASRFRLVGHCRKNALGRLRCHAHGIHPRPCSLRDDICSTLDAACPCDFDPLSDKAIQSRIRHVARSREYRQRKKRLELQLNGGNLPENTREILPKEKFEVQKQRAIPKESHMAGRCSDEGLGTRRCIMIHQKCSHERYPSTGLEYPRESDSSKSGKTTRQQVEEISHPAVTGPHSKQTLDDNVSRKRHTMPQGTQIIRPQGAKEIHIIGGLPALEAQPHTVTLPLGICRHGGGFELRCFTKNRKCADHECPYKGAFCQCTIDPYAVERETTKRSRPEAGKKTLKQQEAELLAAPTTTAHPTGQCCRFGKTTTVCRFLRRRCSLWCFDLGAECQCDYNPYDRDMRELEQTRKSISDSRPKRRIKIPTIEQKSHRRIKHKVDTKSLERRMQPQKESHADRRNEEQILATAIETRLTGGCRNAWSEGVLFHFYLGISSDRIRLDKSSCPCTQDHYSHEKRLTRSRNSIDHSTILHQGQRLQPTGTSEQLVIYLPGRHLYASSQVLKSHSMARVCSDRNCPPGLTELCLCASKGLVRCQIARVSRFDQDYPLGCASSRCSYMPYVDDANAESILSKPISKYKTGEGSLERGIVQEEVEGRNNSTNSSSQLFGFVVVVLGSHSQTPSNYAFGLDDQERKSLDRRSKLDELGKKRPRLKFSEKHGAPQMKGVKKDTMQQKDFRTFKELQHTVAQPSSHPSKGPSFSRGLCRAVARGLNILRCFAGPTLCSLAPCSPAQSVCECTFDPTSQAYPQLGQKRGSEEEKQAPAPPTPKGTMDIIPQGANGMLQGICKNDGGRGFSCFAGRRKCSIDPCPSELSSCECHFDPAVTPLPSQYYRIRQRKEQDHQQQKLEQNQPKGLRIFTGRASPSIEKQPLPMGKCRLNTARDLVCFLSFNLCSHHCLVYGSICPCTFNPRADDSEANKSRRKNRKDQLRWAARHQTYTKLLAGLPHANAEHKTQQKIDKRIHRPNGPLDTRPAALTQNGLPQGRCRPNNSGGLLGCYIKTKRCSDEPCASIFSPCECAFDPEFRAAVPPRTMKAKQQSQTKPAKVQQQSEAQPGDRESGPKTSIQQAAPSLLPEGRCKPNTNGNLMGCYVGRRKCSKRPCLLRGSPCKCIFDPGVYTAR